MRHVVRPQQLAATALDAKPHMHAKARLNPFLDFVPGDVPTGPLVEPRPVIPSQNGRPPLHENEKAIVRPVPRGCTGRADQPGRSRSGSAHNCASRAPRAHDQHRVEPLRRNFRFHEASTCGVYD